MSAKIQLCLFMLWGEGIRRRPVGSWQVSPHWGRLCADPISHLVCIAQLFVKLVKIRQGSFEHPDVLRFCFTVKCWHINAQLNLFYW